MVSISYSPLQKQQAFDQKKGIYSISMNKAKYEQNLNTFGIYSLVISYIFVYDINFT